jgi:hypothetical protein
MMLRVLILSLTLLTGLAHATVLQRPIDLDTGNGELFGSLLLPQSDTPVPVVLIIAGSGPTDRDGNNPMAGAIDSLKRLAWVLAKHNIASVRYDKRGVAASQPATRRAQPAWSATSPMLWPGARSSKPIRASAR